VANSKAKKLPFLSFFSSIFSLSDRCYTKFFGMINNQLALWQSSAYNWASCVSSKLKILGFTRSNSKMKLKCKKLGSKYLLDFFWESEWRNSNLFQVVILILDSPIPLQWFHFGYSNFDLNSLIFFNYSNLMNPDIIKISLSIPNVLNIQEYYKNLNLRKPKEMYS